MIVVIDGVIYQYQARGGISRLYSEILPRVCNLDNSVQMTLLTTGRCKQTPPIHNRIRHKSLLPLDDLMRPRRLWWSMLQSSRAWLQNLVVGNTEQVIWHSTYYTLPMRWLGPAVVTVYDMIHERFPNFFDGSLNHRFREQKLRCIQAADRVICISETTKQDVIDFYQVDAAKVYAVPLASSPIFLQENGFDFANRELPANPFILYVGSRGGYKNFTTLLHAYAGWNRHLEIHLVLVGPPWTKAEQVDLVTTGCAENVHHLGQVDDSQLRNLYNNALAFVFPSLYEGFGIPLLEAMACGCPIVASRIPSTVEVADICPIYFEPTDTASLCSALDIALREGRSSQRTVLGLAKARKYSWDRAAQETLKVYRDLVVSLE